RVGALPAADRRRTQHRRRHGAGAQRAVARRRAAAGRTGAPANTARASRDGHLGQQGQRQGSRHQLPQQHGGPVRLMKQPKKLKQRPNLKRRLDTVRTRPEPDVTFTVTLPAEVYRTLEGVAGGNVPAWVEQTLIEYVAGELRSDEIDGAGD